MGPSQDADIKDTRVLLVDDNQLTRSILRTILREDGYHAIREAKDAESALAVVHHFKPELICLDVQMPGKTGVELLAELKVLSPETKVLMVTAHGDRDTVESSIKAKADGYIVKPFRADKLLKTIHGMMGH